MQDDESGDLNEQSNNLNNSNNSYNLNNLDSSNNSNNSRCICVTFKPASVTVVSG